MYNIAVPSLEKLHEENKRLTEAYSILDKELMRLLDVGLKPEHWADVDFSREKAQQALRGDA